MRAAAQSEDDGSALGRWLRELREASGLSQEALAGAVGTDRRNIHRWEVQGHDPGGSTLLRVLSALGVRLEPPPRNGAKAVNAELRELQSRVADAGDAAATRHDQLLARLDAQDDQLRRLTARLGEMSSRNE
ncbi:MAG: helix-turn-helix transcriptional regulator [Gaiellaceae bacterium]